MASHWQASPLVASPSYPNSIAWSSENLVAIASGHIITILNPALLVGPRGMITLQPSVPFTLQVVDISNLLCDYLTKTNFGEPNLPTSELPLAVLRPLNAILPQKETIEGTKLGKRRIKSQGLSSSKDPVCKRSVKKEISQRKELTHGTNGGSSQKHELLKWEDTTAADEAIANNNKLVNAHSIFELQPRQNEMYMFNCNSHFCWIFLDIFVGS